ncbi:DUF368 domain-containing protein [Eggerthellaceae bacterium zg-893]|nr:DUF368 domain-containing protein [Eggerthellaceae bacterium zg-893]
MLVQFIRGFCMALADSVPGVSGGTIAFLLGFYDRFISSLDDVVHGGRDARKAAVLWLIKLGIGWVFGFVLAVLVLTSLFEEHIYEVSSLFMGFIICAIPIVAFQERAGLRQKWPFAFFVLAGAALVVGVTLVNPLSGDGLGIDVAALTPLAAAYVFVAAMVAISAMVLPGISGSTLLLIFGLYLPILGAVRGLIGLDFTYLPVVLVFIAGVVCGIALVVRLVRFCLEHFRGQTIYLIIGMMIGSLYAIAKGPLTLDVPQPPLAPETFSLLFFLLGAVIVAALQGLQWLLSRGKAAEQQTSIPRAASKTGAMSRVQTGAAAADVQGTGRFQAVGPDAAEQPSQSVKPVVSPGHTRSSASGGRSKAERGAHARK